MIDYAIVGLYLLSVLLIGFYYSFRIKSVSEYTTAGRNYPTSVIVATIFATIIGGASTMGVAEQFFSVGAIFFVVCLGASFRDVITAQWIVPNMGDLTGHLSSGDIMKSYFGKPGQLLTGTAVLLRCVVAVGTQVSAMGFLGNYFLDIPYSISAVGATTIVILYSSFGGIRSVTITDVIQFGVLIVAIPIMCNFGVSAAGGLGAIINTIPAGHTAIPADPLINLKFLSLAFVFLLPDLDPAVIQRILMGRDLEQGRTSMLISSLASILLYALAGIIGLVALSIKPDLEPNLALPFLLNTVLPMGIKGLAVAGILAVIMSTADSYLNIGGISLVHDLIRPLKNNNLTDKGELRLMQFATLFLGIGAAFCALVLPNVFELTVACLALWKPVIFPPMLMGMLGLLKNQRLFYFGIISSVATLFLWNSYVKSWLIVDGILIAAFVHFIILLSPHVSRKIFHLALKNREAIS